MVGHLQICNKLEGGFTTKAIRPRRLGNFAYWLQVSFILPRRMALESPIEYFP